MVITRAGSSLEFGRSSGRPWHQIQILKSPGALCQIKTSARGVEQALFPELPSAAKVFHQFVDREVSRVIKDALVSVIDQGANAPCCAQIVPGIGEREPRYLVFKGHPVKRVDEDHQRPSQIAGEAPLPLPVPNRGSSSVPVYSRSEMP